MVIVIIHHAHDLTDVSSMSHALCFCKLVLYGVLYVVQTRLQHRFFSLHAY
jgi:hypothetical protein